ncbi:MAG: hypothetical protein IPN69_07720 [Acidobacteria bacterium]|nr:hypothetical protein [Acidobacteriota bacterium]
MDRREFISRLTATGFATLASTAVGFAGPSPELKIIVFQEKGFPIVNGFEGAEAALDSALRGHRVVFADSARLPQALAAGADLFVNPYGAAFPKSAWPAIFGYLSKGGNLLNLGGVPFAVPVANGRAETRQVNFHKRLGILQSFECVPAITYRSDVLNALPESIRVKRCFALYPKLTTRVDFPDESGSDGTREATLSALAHGLDARQRVISAPAVLIDRRLGEFAGGRWVFATFEGTANPELIRQLAEIAAVGALEINAATDFACYEEKWIPILKISAEDPARPGTLTAQSVGIEVADANGTRVFGNVRTDAGKIDGSNPLRIVLSDGIYPYAPGYYTVNITLSINRTGRPHARALKTGFWIRDPALLASGSAITADRHFLNRDGKPFPVTGTTYMASDVARRFLLEPNPAVWYDDFAAMKSSGVNMIRTGIWTGWKLYLNPDGTVREPVLRAFEAFLLTARKFDIPVMFTFFAFIPETFGGKNAYLDPKAIDGQKRFLRAFARRARKARDVSWDLINEPSFANPKNLWSCRPNYDEFEKDAWRAWLAKKFDESNEIELAEILRSKWRLTDREDPFDLPRFEDFESVNIIADRRPMKALDFRLFAQDIFADWARDLATTLRAEGSAEQLVTVGQDEGGTGDSPSPQFHSASVDLTSLHNWWSNDDLLWDNVVSKSPDTPNLIQETGVMSYEKADGSAWRDEQTVADLLNRKMALGIGANACGFIEWIWNTNPFMNIDNEAGIGFLRVDGSAKPELRVFEDLAVWVRRNRDNFQGRIDEQALLVIPHSYQFTPRNFAGEATKRAVRVAHYHLRQMLRAVSEYRLGSLRETPRVLLIPSPRVLTDAAWTRILEMARNGATVAITGFFEENEYLEPRERLGAMTEIGGAVPVAQFESFRIGDKDLQVRFGGEKIQRLERAKAEDTVRIFPVGNGRIIWSPVPLEVGDTLVPIEEFYRLVFQEAKLEPLFELRDGNPSLLVRATEFADSILYLAINEASKPQDVRLRNRSNNTGFWIELPPGKTALTFVAK